MSRIVLVLALAATPALALDAEWVPAKDEELSKWKQQARPVVVDDEAEEADRLDKSVQLMNLKAHRVAEENLETPFQQMMRKKHEAEVQAAAKAKVDAGVVSKLKLAQRQAGKAKRLEQSAKEKLEAQLAQSEIDRSRDQRLALRDIKAKDQEVLALRKELQKPDNVAATKLKNTMRVVQQHAADEEADTKKRRELQNKLNQDVLLNPEEALQLKRRAEQEDEVAGMRYREAHAAADEQRKIVEAAKMAVQESVGEVQEWAKAAGKVELVKDHGNLSRARGDVASLLQTAVVEEEGMLKEQKTHDLD